MGLKRENLVVTVVVGSLQMTLKCEIELSYYSGLSSLTRDSYGVSAQFADEKSQLFS